MGEKLHAAKKLPIRIFHQVSNDIFVAQIVLKFKIVKILGASPEAFNYAGGFERLDERSELRGIGPEIE